MIIGFVNLNPLDRLESVTSNDELLQCLTRHRYTLYFEQVRIYPNTVSLEVFGWFNLLRCLLIGSRWVW